jgi:toxin ParE1/3/4
VAKLVYLDSARQDLIGILRYIAKASGSVAIGQNFTGLLRQKCRYLAELPGDMGRLRPELGPDIRSSAFRGYVIFFRLRDDLFEVINILEGHRDVESHFENLPPDTFET